MQETKSTGTTKSSGFVPMRLENLPHVDYNSAKTTVTTTLKGVVADEFEKLCSESGLNKSQLLVQMVYHCLNRTEDLREFYRRLAILGK